MVPRALTIAGSDSGGGAGIQADLKTFMAHGVYGASAITAITAQNTVEVRAVVMLEPAMVVAQIEAVLDDIGADAVKTGMLGNAAIIEAVADTLERYRVERLVIDPVMVAKSGARLLEEDAITTLRERMLPLALVITPNLPEASVLLNRQVIDERAMRDAARDLHALGPRYVLLKGGHLPGSDVVDLLYDGEQFVELRAQRLETNHTHGTGCTYAAAIAALIARGLPVEQAVRQAHAYLHDAIVYAPAIGKGFGPVNHLVHGLPAER
ncbi:MAG: bifunctional hydroxymethylpyrimidine kinase/phosphomethylpyrimidine kinase [Roseiflexus sp.]|nr:bifunctional hydroxymethylpyrimidine kinase/phosphomethylpyrimidine kinase [Roseiflexus sp.]MCS7288483.1 bifunctional hydroxymethylpyrimidine kinase/phosphomethylpyrimidine kinase [Roseiflexus sp.]MDW8147500.1 bifunctional hydroxymethylpyrimidine kinase/phosphomethylpyrimidine kinase [Roseiflexaceae bacterium]MDW8234054.1 bifunctional hydroxymethylpyrimidine kinase/phosphomethylpyrimidine kinase [Roseiflexaceae bacterium]